MIGLGGATEATVWSNYYPIKEVDPHWMSIPYGQPIQNAKYYILDQNLNPTPIGIPGYLYIGDEDFQPLDAEAQLTLLSARLESVNLLPPEAGINYVRCIVQVIKADELAYLRYVPPTGYPNRITLFKTSDIYQDELGMLDEKIPADPAWGWGHLSTEPVEVHVVPGNHTTMLTEPQVQVLAEKLRKCLF